MKRIENILALPALVLLVQALVLGGQSFDFHLHDTYFVVDNVFIQRWFIAVLVMIWFMYTIIRRKNQQVNGVWAVPHIMLTSVSVLLLCFVSYENRVTGMAGMPRRYYDYSNWSGLNWSTNNILLVTAFLVFVLYQLIFLVYFLTRLFKKT